MTLFRYGTGRWRRLTRGLLLLIGLTAVIAFAMVGAVIAIAVLAAGAIVHALVSFVRASRVPSPSRAGASSTASSNVIEGEFVVIERGGKGLRPTH